MTDSIPTLVETEWLAENLDNSISASSMLPGICRRSSATVSRTTTPVIFQAPFSGISTPLPIRNLPAPHDAGRNNVPGYMKMLGIGSDHHVIVYDNMKMMTAPRVWWTLRVFGHERVSLLNGGQNKWSAEDRPDDGRP